MSATPCKATIPSENPGSLAGSCPNPVVPPTGFCQEHFELVYPLELRSRRQAARDLEAAALEAARAEAAEEAG